jgi:hypothetical protein
MSAEMWAVCRIKDTADSGSYPGASRWPVPMDGVHSYQLLRGPFDSEIEACAELLRHVGAYPDTEEGFAAAVVFVSRVRTRTQAINDYVAENAPAVVLAHLPEGVPPEAVAAAKALFRPYARIEPALPPEVPRWHGSAAAQIGDRP